MYIKRVSQEELQEILEKHRLWLENKPGGEQANLSNVYLYGTDLHDANLRKANLSFVDLCDANLRNADLSGANLSGTKLCGANLYNADLCKAQLSYASLFFANLCHARLNGANLFYTELKGANLSGAMLSGAINLDTVLIDEYTSFFTLQCPEKGAYVAYKEASGFIVELEIPADAMRSSATTRKCRANKAKVLSITDVHGNPAGVQAVVDHNFRYVVGQTVEVKDFDPDRWNETSAGIYHFMTRQEAVAA